MRLAAPPKAFVLMASVVWIGGCAHAAFGQTRPEPTMSGPTTSAYDPAEGFNRKVFGFNQLLDRHVVSPVARGYTALPQTARSAVRNVLTNLSEPQVFINDVLQLNVGRAGVTVARFGVNSTVGLAGLFDVARNLNLKHHDGDLGVTMGRWGVPPGAAVQLPLIGPSNLRDTAGLVAGGFLNPMSYAAGNGVTAARASLGVTGMVDGRARQLPLTDKLQAAAPDYYATLRDVSAGHRQALVVEAQGGEVAASQADQAPALAIPDVTPLAAPQPPQT